MSLPRLIAFEGPAGAGKTSMARCLAKVLRQQGRRVELLAEFSDSDLGRLLAQHSNFGVSPRSWQAGFGGLMLYTADRLIGLERASDYVSADCISDRFLLSQVVLGLPALEAGPTREAGRRVLDAATGWATATFSNSSSIVWLDADSNLLAERIGRRRGRPIRACELGELERQRAAYRRLKRVPREWRHIDVDSSAPIDQATQALCDQLLGDGAP